MSGGYSDGEGSVVPDADFLDATAETEVELRLPPAVDRTPDQPPEDVLTYPGAVDPEAVDLDQDMQRRFEPLRRAKPKWPRHGLPLPSILEPRGQSSGAVASLVGSGVGHRKRGAANPTYPGLARDLTNLEMKYQKNLTRTNGLDCRPATVG